MSRLKQKQTHTNILYNNQIHLEKLDTSVHTATDGENIFGLRSGRRDNVCWFEIASSCFRRIPCLLWSLHPTEWPNFDTEQWTQLFLCLLREGCSLFFSSLSGCIGQNHGIHWCKCVLISVLYIHKNKESSLVTRRIKAWKTKSSLSVSNCTMFAILLIIF